MYLVYNLLTGQENYYANERDKRQALKTSYAISNNLGSRLATDYDGLMKELDHKVVETEKTLGIGDWAVVK